MSAIAPRAALVGHSVRWDAGRRVFFAEYKLRVGMGHVKGARYTDFRRLHSDVEAIAAEDSSVRTPVVRNCDKVLVRTLHMFECLHAALLAVDFLASAVTWSNTHEWRLECRDKRADSFSIGLPRFSSQRCGLQCNDSARSSSILRFAGQPLRCSRDGPGRGRHRGRGRGCCPCSYAEGAQTTIPCAPWLGFNGGPNEPKVCYLREAGG